MNQPKTVTDIAAHALEALGDVFYDPDPLVDGYSSDDLRQDALQAIAEAINQALDQQRAQSTNHLAIVLWLARSAFAEHAELVITQRDQLPEAESAAAFAKAQATEEALATVAHMGGFSDSGEAARQGRELLAMPPMRKPWTVVGGYYDLDFEHPDNTWVEWVYADTPKQAARAAIRKLIHNNHGTYTATELVVLAVFNGWHADKLAGKRGQRPS